MIFRAFYIINQKLDQAEIFVAAARGMLDLQTITLDYLEEPHVGLGRLWLEKNQAVRGLLGEVKIHTVEEEVVFENVIGALSDAQAIFSDLSLRQEKLEVQPEANQESEEDKCKEELRNKIKIVSQDILRLGAVNHSSASTLFKRYIFLIGAPFFLLVIIVLGILCWVAERIMKPLKRFEDDISTITQGHFEHRVTFATEDEFGRLARAFEKMMLKIRESRQKISDQVGDQTKELLRHKRELEEQQKAILNILEDAEEEKNKVKHEKIRTDSLLGSIGDGIIATDQDGRVMLVNKSAQDILGYKEKEMQNKSVVDVLQMVDEEGKPIPLTKRPMVLALSTGKKTGVPFGETYYYLRKDGSRFPSGITVAPYVWEEKIIGTIQVFRDITIEKDVDRAKTEFVSLASHQLRTPLSAIKWFSEMLLAGDVGELTKKQKDYLTEVYEGNQRMIDLVNSLLNVSRIELGTFAVEPEPTKLTDITESILKEEFFSIRKKKLKVTVDYDPQLPIMNVDPKLTRIIFQNLLSNAIKYTPEKGKVKLTITKRKEDILIKVADTGCGIPQKDQRKIFSKMFRADNVKEQDTTGSGLGLYIVKAIIEISEGKIWFKSKENKGTTFYVALPLAGMTKKEGTRALTE